MGTFPVTALPTHSFDRSWDVRVLPAAPMIAPARQFVFPVAVPGEEDALARGALWLEVKPANGGTFLAQCALGFAGKGVATGVWSLPDPDSLLAVAGGYAYRILTTQPDETVLLPMRPVVEVCCYPAEAAVILVGFHALFVVGRNDAWQSPRLSWEGVTVSGVEDGVLHGTGWHMRSDRDVPFALNLRTRELTGGGFLP